MRRASKLTQEEISVQEKQFIQSLQHKEKTTIVSDYRAHHLPDF